MLLLIIAFFVLYIIYGAYLKKARVPQMEQELLTIPEHLVSPQFSVAFVLLDL